MRLEIRYNSNTDKTQCFICHAEVQPMDGPGLLFLGAQEPVCHDCGEKESPRLMAQLAKAQKWTRVTELANALASGQPLTEAGLQKVLDAFFEDDPAKEYPEYALQHLIKALKKGVKA